MLQTLGPKGDQGMVMLILSEIARLKRMPELAHAIKNFQPKPDPFQQQMQQLELAAKQSEIDKNKAQADLYEAQAKAAGAVADKTNLDYVEQETGTKHARDMQKQEAQAQGNQDLEVTKALLAKRKLANGAESRPDIPAAVGYNQLSKNMTGVGSPGNIPQDNFAGQNPADNPVAPQFQPA